MSIHVETSHSSVDAKHAVKSIAFAQTSPRKPFITDQRSPDMACGVKPNAPALIAPARAGSQIKFQWNPWYNSHKGPLITYLAPYEGAVQNVDVNKLSFFKISEKGLAADNRTWAVDEMMANGNISSTVIPYDIKPGTYILRHELIALHYSTEDSLYHMKADKLLGPQVSYDLFTLYLKAKDLLHSIISNASISASKALDLLNQMAWYSQEHTSCFGKNQVSTSTSGGTFRHIPSQVQHYTVPRAQPHSLHNCPCLHRVQQAILQKIRSISPHF